MSAKPERILLSVSQAAARLGVSPSTLRAMTNEIPPRIPYERAYNGDRVFELTAVVAEKARRSDGKRTKKNSGTEAQ